MTKLYPKRYICQALFFSKIKMPEHKKYEPPEATLIDRALVLARAGISAVSVVGGPMVELFNALVTPPLTKRQQEWRKEIGECLDRLEKEEKINLEQLQHNEAFIDIVLQASQIAMRTSQEEKRNALRNAILNAALNCPIELAMQQTFLSLIDNFNSWHIRILKVMQNPTVWFKEKGKQWPNLSMGGKSHILELAYPELRGKRNFYDILWKDLYSAGLVHGDSLHVTMTGSGLMNKGATEIGDLFINFIEGEI